MAALFGRTYTRDDLRRYTGDMSQLAGIRLGELGDGPARGVRTAEFYTGGGFHFTVLIDRGMDIGPASYNGYPLAWMPPLGFPHPAYYDAQGLGWLRSFGGGLLTGCGLGWFGAPTTDQGQELGLHGRLSNTPARNISSGAEWQGDDYVLWIQGEMRETALFNDHFALTRRISTRLGARSLRIEDRLENIGFAPADHMMLYHINFGFPVVSPQSELVADSASVTPRDAAAQAGAEDYTHFDEPSSGYPEQVFFHQIRPDASGFSRAQIVNRALGIGAYVQYRADTLPWLIQWKMMGAGEYVCGLEPATSGAGHRAAAREAGMIRTLQPGEILTYDLQIGALAPDELG